MINLINKKVGQVVTPYWIYNRTRHLTRWRSRSFSIFSYLFQFMICVIKVIIQTLSSCPENLNDQPFIPRRTIIAHICVRRHQCTVPYPHISMGCAVFRVVVPTIFFRLLIFTCAAIIHIVSANSFQLRIHNHIRVVWITLSWVWVNKLMTIISRSVSNRYINLSKCI